MADKKPTQSQQIEALEDKVKHLEGAISRIAVLTGNGNHLREIGIERWVPSKQHMSKRN